MIAFLVWNQMLAVPLTALKERLLLRFAVGEEI